MAFQTPVPFLMKQRTVAPLDFTKVKARNGFSLVQRIPVYLQIPEQTLANTWRGASEIITRYILQKSIVPNFLNLLDSIPDDPKFVLAISWYENDITTRYKLWEDVGEILYYPLYEGQTPETETYAIEVWNTDNDPIVIPEMLFRVGRYVDPSSKCDSTAQFIISDFTECGDPIFHYLIDSYNPSAGDFYIFQDYCTRIIQRGTLIVFPYNILYCPEDDTWHYVWTKTNFGNVGFNIDPSPAVPPPDALGYFPMQNHDDMASVYKINLKLLMGNYHFTVRELLISSPVTYVTIGIQNITDTFYYPIFLKNAVNPILNIGQSVVA